MGDGAVLHKGLPGENNAGMLVRPEGGSGSSLGVLAAGVAVSEASGAPRYGSVTPDPDPLPGTLLLTFGPELQPATPIASAISKERVPEGRGLIEAKTVPTTSATRAGGTNAAPTGHNPHQARCGGAEWGGASRPPGR